MNKINQTSFVHRGMVMTVLCVSVAFSLVAQAQSSIKSVVPEPVPAFTALSQWLNTHLRPFTSGAAVAAPQVHAWPVASESRRSYEPQPVIVGLPDLPLTGGTLANAGQRWDGKLNYQGVHMSLLVLDASGRVTQRPISAPVAVGDRFKLRITPTFDAVSELDQVVGGVWRGQRTGQAYPAPGKSVAIKAGETVDLPLGADLFFMVDGQTPDERMVVSVRHPKALHKAASEQPSYRQDGARGSSYVQLVPDAQYPKIEQVISVR